MVTCQKLIQWVKGPLQEPLPETPFMLRSTFGWILTVQQEYLENYRLWFHLVSKSRLKHIVIKKLWSRIDTFNL